MHDFRREALLSYLVLAVVALGGSSGCGRGSGLEKVVVSGTVSYDGQAVENGDIRFYPIEGTKGAVSGASIKDGKYVAEGKGGVPVGRHLVQIRGFRSGETQQASDDLIGVVESTPPRAERGQYIPVKYNKDSELVVEVDRKQNAHDFDLAK